MHRSIDDLRLRLLRRGNDRTYRHLADAKFVAELATSRNSIDRQREAMPPGGVDAERLAAEQAVEHHSKRADEYFGSGVDETTHAQTDAAHILKPFTDSVEAAHHLAAVADLLSGLDVASGMRVLDFGCGNGWISRILVQLGCDVVLCDVSNTALELAAEAFRVSPPLESPQHREPQSLLFDGRRLELDDGSIDRIICFDAFHHVPNRAEVMAEMYRVLAPDGIAGFHEPGPDHSRKPASQYEMVNFGFLERDIRIGDIKRLSDEVGFSDLRLNLSAPVMPRLGVTEYNSFLRWGHIPLTFRRLMWHDASDTRAFYLIKSDGRPPDSRQSAGLAARIDVVDITSPRADDQVGRFLVTLKNSGRARWLPSTHPTGGVRLGAHLYDADGVLQNLDFCRWDLPGSGVAPGDSTELMITLPSTSADSVVVLDLVSENVTWFAKHGSTPVELPTTPT